MKTAGILALAALVAFVGIPLAFHAVPELAVIVGEFWFGPAQLVPVPVLI